MNYTKEDLIIALDRVYNHLGRFPTRRELREISYIGESAFYRVFGSLSTAKEYYLNNTTKKIQEEIDTGKRSIKDGLIDTLKKNLSEHELKILVESSGINSNKPNANISKTIKLETGHFKFIATGDSHIGHNKFRDDWWDAMIQWGIDEDVNFMYHTGDILEGMSGRPGHVYELAQIGFEAQFAKAKSLIKQIPFEVRFITGNHDNWYTGKADQGINVGLRLQESLDNVVFLGTDEADDIVNGVKIKLWHGNDGASHAFSYRTQKFVEMLTGGEKPHILLAGHAHKSIFYETRNVHVLETGTTCSQSSFMRGKKLASHNGFWIVDIWTNKEGISRIRPEWHPFYI